MAGEVEAIKDWPSIGGERLFTPPVREEHEPNVWKENWDVANILQTRQNWKRNRINFNITAGPARGFVFVPLLIRQSHNPLLCFKQSTKLTTTVASSVRVKQRHGKLCFPNKSGFTLQAIHTRELVIYQYNTTGKRCTRNWPKTIEPNFVKLLFPGCRSPVYQPSNLPTSPWICWLPHPHLTSVPIVKLVHRIQPKSTIATLLVCKRSRCSPHVLFNLKGGHPPLAWHKIDQIAILV